MTQRMKYSSHHGPLLDRNRDEDAELAPWPWVPKLVLIAFVVVVVLAVFLVSGK